MNPLEGEENRESVPSLMDEANGGSKDDGLGEGREDYLRTSEENKELSTNGCNGDGEFTLDAENRRRYNEFECCRGRSSENFVKEGTRDEKFGKKFGKENDGDDLTERLGNDNDGDDLAERLGKENEVDDRIELDGSAESEFANGWHEALQHMGCSHGIGKKIPKLQTFSSPLVSGLRLLEDWRSLDRCVSASAKGFAIGAGLKGGLALFSILVRFKRRSLSARMVGDGIRTNSDAISEALKETFRYGLFLGTFAGTFASVDEAIAAFGGRARTASWRSLLAGGIAGPSMLLTGLNTQHTSLAVYILMRASVLAARCGIKSEKFGYLCRPLTWTYGDVFLMCLSSSQILSAYILNQDSLPSTYRSFLNKHGGKDPNILKAIKELASCMPLTSLAGVEKYYKSNGVDIKLHPNIKVPCSIVHANQTCARHAISFLVQAYARALPVYLPVYLIPALIVHRQGLLKEPRSIFGKTLFGTARSSLFLSVYCSSAWTWTCLLFHLIKKCSIPAVAAGTFPTGLALLIEKKSRRMEIALYCFARALESFFTNIADAGLLPHGKKLKRVDVILFSLSTAVIMHCYAQERDVFRSKYLNVLDWVFGVPHDIECSIDQINSNVSITKKPEHIL